MNDAARVGAVAVFAGLVAWISTSFDTSSPSRLNELATKRRELNAECNRTPSEMQVGQLAVADALGVRNGIRFAIDTEVWIGMGSDARAGLAFTLWCARPKGSDIVLILDEVTKRRLGRFGPSGAEGIWP